jgi:spermidine/putrescine transport system permease protein
VTELRVQQAAPNKPSLRERLGRVSTPVLVIFPAAFLLIFFFVVPMIVALRYSFMHTMPFFDPETRYTLDNYIRVFTQPVYRRSFLRTGLYAGIATSISLVLSYPVAYYLSRLSKKGGLLLLILIIPFWTSVVLRVFSWRIILGTSGPLNSILLSLGLIDEPIRFLYSAGGIIFGLVYTYTPFMVLPLYAALGKVPNQLLEASEDLGANKLQTLFNITLPLTRSGTTSAVILVLLSCFADVLAANMLGGPNTLMISTVIFETFLGGANWVVGSALSVVVFTTLLLMSALLARIGREPEYA